MTPAITGLANTDSKRSPKRARYNESSLYVLQIDKDVLLQHAQRTVYQAGIWTSSEHALQDVPSPTEFSWVKGESNQWQPVWMTIPKFLLSAES